MPVWVMKSFHDIPQSGVQPHLSYRPLELKRFAQSLEKCPYPWHSWYMGEVSAN